MSPLTTNLVLPDAEERRTLWSAIIRRCLRLQEKHGIQAYLYHHDHLDITRREIPVIETWKLVEVLCALLVLDDADEVRTKLIRGLAQNCGPIEYSSAYGTRYLFTQASMVGSHSKLAGTPDIVVATSTHISCRSVERIIECKSGKRLGAPLVRAEFGKGYDLNVDVYQIWSLNKAAAGAVDGAMALGIDIVELRFNDKSKRKELLDPDQLSTFMTYELKRADAARAFAMRREQVAVETRERGRQIPQRPFED